MRILNFFDEFNYNKQIFDIFFRSRTKFRNQTHLNIKNMCMDGIRNCLCDLKKIFVVKFSNNDL